MIAAVFMLSYAARRIYGQRGLLLFGDAEWESPFAKTNGVWDGAPAFGNYNHAHALHQHRSKNYWSLRGNYGQLSSRDGSGN